MPDETHPADDREQLELADLLSRVLDKGAVITGTVLLSVADVDLVKLGISLVLTSVETETLRRRPRTIARAAGGLAAQDAGAGAARRADDDLAVLPPPPGE